MTKSFCSYIMYFNMSVTVEFFVVLLSSNSAMIIVACSNINQAEEKFLRFIS